MSPSSPSRLSDLDLLWRHAVDMAAEWLHHYVSLWAAFIFPTTLTVFQAVAYMPLRLFPNCKSTNKMPFSDFYEAAQSDELERAGRPLGDAWMPGVWLRYSSSGFPPLGTVTIYKNINKGCWFAVILHCHVWASPTAWFISGLMWFMCAHNLEETNKEGLHRSLWVTGKIKRRQHKWHAA